MARPVVVKFGGSLLGSPESGALLAAAARHKAVVAPGGGPFADAVREAQVAHGLSDAAAHAMAIVAMDQTAVLLANLDPQFTLCASVEQFDAAFAAGRPAIWRPSRMALAADLPASWEVTSDSLALWLAMALGAPRLVLLKAAAVPKGTGAKAWAAAGLVDRHFAALAQKFTEEIVGLGPATAAALDRVLAAPLRRAA